jgi:hypothetical protein
MHSLKLVEEDSVLLAQPLLIEQFGRAGAQFLNQLHYWLSKKAGITDPSGLRWVYNTEASWSQQLKLSVRQLRRYVSRFTEEGIIHVQKLSSHKSNRTNYYTINYEALAQCLGSTEGLVSSESPRNVHEDIVSSSRGHHGRMVIHRLTHRKTKKDKSEGTAVERVESQTPVCLTEEQKSISQVADFVFSSGDKGEEGRGELEPPPIAKVVCGESLLGGKDAGDSHRPDKASKPNTTVQDMVALWNERFPKAYATLSKPLARHLMGAFKHKFDSSMDQWKAYCERIASSTYLMGEGFTLSLSWALKFATIDRIGQGELGVKPQAESIKAVDTEALHVQAQAHIAYVAEGAGAKQLRTQLLEAFGAAKYTSWLTQVDLVEGEGGALRLKAHNRFVEDYVFKEYGSILSLAA